MRFTPLQSPRASIIVPTFNDWPDLERCLSCLADQNIASEEFEIIVANNNHVSDIPENFVLPSNARIIWIPKPGSYAARNAALEEAEGEAILFTDSDCRPSRNWLASALQEFDKSPETMRCSGPVELCPETGEWNACSLYDSLFCLDQRAFAELGKAATANLAVRREVFDEVGNFDENAFSGGDMEWGVRAENAGAGLEFVEEMIVRHSTRDRLRLHVKKERRKAGARFVSRQSSHPFARRVPRLELMFPSLRALRKALSAKEHPMRLRLGAWAVHYCLRWVDIVETIRVGILGGTPERS